MPGGDTQMRDQALDKDRRKFTSGLIRAIEELEVRRATRSPQQLADAAWQKLQYDFPLVETCELQALLEAFSASFVGKAGWPCYLLTHKALENISNGARGAGSYAPQLSEQEQQVQQMLSEGLTQKVLARSSSSSRSNGSSSAQPAAAEPPSQQQLYQQLAAVLLLQYAAKVASLPDQEAWQLMQAYCPEQEHEQEHEQEQEHSQQQGQGGPGDVDAAVAAAMAAVAADPVASGGCSCQIYDDTEAAQQDGDSEEYEPLEAAAAQPQPRHTHTHNPSPQDSRPYSWPALHHKLLSLADHVHYSLFACEPLWRQRGADQHLLQLLRLLGVHGHAQELQPLLHAYVGVLVDRLAAAPQDLPLLHQLWEALGLTAESGLRQPRCSGAQQQQGLHAEAVLGLSVAAAVWQQLPAASARKQLWQLMHGQLLPLLESCAEQLAYSSKRANSSNGAAAAAAAGAAGGAAAVQGMAFAHVLLLCHLLELLVLGRPGHVDVAQQLTELGLTRSLVQLHGQWGCEAAAEPLRRALLLACCSSRHTAAWVLAVPSVRQQLQQQPFMLGGPFETHGALWQLLLHAASSQPATKPPAAAAAGAASLAAASDAAQQQLLSLLTLQSSDSQQLQRQVLVLQLMADAQRAAGSRQRLWSDAVLSALRKLAGKLTEEAVPSSDDTVAAAAAAAAAAASKARPSSDSDTDSEDAGSTDGRTGRAGKQQPQQHTEVEKTLEHRRSAQLLPTALRLVKELLTQGGGKTD